MNSLTCSHRTPKRSDQKMGEKTTNTDDLSHHLPLHLIKSEIIPPAPNPAQFGSKSPIDWLPDFAGYSWVAYGASSLLIISHFPSPLSPQQTRMGPIFRHVFELHSPSFADVSAVAWSPATPSSGDLAAVADNRIFVFQYDSKLGSFCWSQTALLLQSAKVDAIAWTGSGDGIFSGGIDVVLWKRNIKSWEIAWRSRMEVSQALVSATWSLEGPSAAGANPTKPPVGGLSSATCSSSYCVSVFQPDGKSGYVTTELRHPRPILGMEWRPSGGSPLLRDALCAPRHVLLTTCLDGVVRLWSEIDGSKTRKNSKDNRDPSATRRSFCVVAVIEINQTLDGTLGTNIFVNWALEVEGVACMDGGLPFSKRPQNDRVGRCEWLIGLGPGKMLSFWAVHCLDDIATMRTPRVTLWKRLEIQGPTLRNLCRNDLPMVTEGSHFNKVAIWRNQMFGPPTLCSLVQLFPCNSLGWSVLYSQSSLNVVDEKSSHKCETDSNLSSQSDGILDTLGHTGKIVQVAVLPFKSEVELAVSLDSHGLVLFWSIFSSPNSVSCLPMLNPSWQLVGKITLQGIISQDMRVYWVPALLDEDRILLIGHAQGIECIIIKTGETDEEKVLCHKLCTIPFISHDHIGVPDELTSFPLHSTCKATFKFNHFLLLAVWMKNCQVAGWKVTLHSCDLSGNCCECNFNTEKNECSTQIYKAVFAGKRYCLAMDPLSSYLPDVHGEVTSIAMVSPSLIMPSLMQKSDLVDDSFPNGYPYYMATGHSDGRSRLWMINLSKLSVTSTPLELVGIFSSLQGPISAIAVADWGQKIATICQTGHTNTATKLCIWEPLHLAGAGTVELEDKICLGGEVVALRWFRMENMLFLGVCFQNELHIYSQRLCCPQTSLNVKKPSEASSWACTAIVRTSPTICDFLPGPRGTIIIIHDKFFSLFSQWSFLMGNKHLNDGNLTPDRSLFINELDDNSSAFLTGNVHIFEELSFERSNEDSSPIPPLTKARIDIPSSLYAKGSRQMCNTQNKNCFMKMTEVAERLCGPLPLYHPEALLVNIYSGNWKRAYVAVCHLVECLAPNSTAEQKLSTTKCSPIVRQLKLSDYFEGQLSKGEGSQGFQSSKDLNSFNWSSYSEAGLMQFADKSVHHDIDSFFATPATTSESCGTHEMLEKLQVVESLTDSQKMKMIAVVDLLREISNSQSTSAYESLDEAGRRFWCSVRLQQLDFKRRYRRMPSIQELAVDSRLIGWAFHSDCQANLFDTLLATEPTWEEMRKMGVGYWFTNLTDMRTKMEKLARCQYLKSKDPKACALLYIALNRLHVLAGLFKISKNEKDKPLVSFLSRNFQEEKHKAAALKNAYVLMGRHQVELAIAFFLLGGDITSAITVCAKTLGDDQLALVICRLVEGQGGPSERHLISKILLPSAIEKGDYWLASIQEWMLGAYLRSFLVILGLLGDSHVSESEESFQLAVFLDPSIGQYCQLLASKHSLKNAVGEQNSAILGRWATVMTASAFNKCGLPLEALVWYSSSGSALGVTDKGTESESSDLLPRILRPFSGDSSRWLSHEVACHLEYQVKLDLAVQYIMKVMREHPCWLDISLLLPEAPACPQEHDMSQYGALLKNFEQKLDSTLAYLEQKFSLIGDLLLNKICVSLDDDRLYLIGYYLLHTFASQVCRYALGNIGSPSPLLKQLTNTADYLSNSVSRFVTASSVASLRPLASFEYGMSVNKPYHYFQFLEWYLRGMIFSICSLRAALMVLLNASNKELIAQSTAILDLCNYCIYFASAMLQRNIKALAVMLRPVLVSCTDGDFGNFEMVNLRAVLSHIVEALGTKSFNAITSKDLLVGQGSHHEDGQERDIMLMVAEDQKWIILGTCLWQYVSKFINYELNQLFNKVTSNSVADTSALTSSMSSGLDENGSLKYLRQATMIFLEAIGNTSTHVLSHTARQLSVFFWQKAEDGTSIVTQMGLEEFSLSNSSGLHEHLHRTFGASEVWNEETSCSELLDKFFGDPKTVSEFLAQLPIKFSQLIQWKPIRRWNDLNMGVLGQHEKLESYKQEGIFDCSQCDESGSPFAGSEQSNNSLNSGEKGAAVMRKVVAFHDPREIYRRNGELLEALCINSVDEHQAALASNRKGISFFSWGDRAYSGNPSDYIWSKAEWPQNGWAGAESTPVPTCVSPGIGLGSDKGLHLGLGGATVGVGSQARVGKDWTGGGAFGIPGYAGIGATGMGWGIQEEFDNFIDPPATLDNINSRTLASHPSMPFFLVGSMNTHIYLWKFGEDKAAATYGVLPAANVPPPYALASITALQFDRCGHRFANSASDGTVCTWQLEVGGRSNVRPTESSLCFSGHASDISYVATSGSIIAAAGYSSNGVNVVIWDTLAPPTSSRASVMCHEGGACSIAVFDNDMGSSSVSPLIVTGGKGGDVGLHDFRYIATGKTKRHRHSNSVERITDVAALDVRSELSSNVGDENRHGMLWYIPKAHSGSVTKITTIPNTSLFLTGSKDGDVKLWDASRARLVFHWPKLHERHTFLQRSSQGYGGVTRVGVTDIQVISDGFLSCGGDGLVKLVQLNN